MRTLGNLASERLIPRLALVAVISVLTVSAAENSSGLIDAIKTGNRQMARTLLRQRPDVNFQEADGRTALHWAARADDAELVPLLIRAGANVTATNRYGITPLALAATNGSATIVEMLLKAGADPSNALPEGETVLMTA